MAERGLWPGWFRAWLSRIFARRKTPQWQLVELEKPVPILNGEDVAAMAALHGHPGVTALLNRLRLRRAALETQLKTTRFKDLDDVNFIQLGCSWLGYVESEIRFATQTTEDRRTARPASPDEVEQFERIMNAIESVRPTQS